MEASHRPERRTYPSSLRSPPQAAHNHPASKLVVVTRPVADGSSPTWVMHDDEGYLLGDEGDDPADPGETHWTDLVVLCAHCLLERYPAAGRGMDLARQGGLACYSQGAWYIQQGDDAA